MAHADKHRAAVGLEIINAEREGDTLGLGTKVVVVDGSGDTLPLPAGIFEIAHQFPLLGIDTDDRVAMTAEAASQAGDVAELLVACGTVPGGDLFAVGAEREIHHVQ